jgi:hypothetical protein
MDINSFVIGFAKGKKSGTGFFSTKENDAGGLTYAFKATEGGGGGSGGGVELNIAYGDTPPEDTTKLWVKTTQPSGVVVKEDLEIVETSGASMVATATSHTTFHGRGAVGAIDGKIYLLGGYPSYTNEIVCYDPETEVFTTLSTTLPEELAYMAYETVGTKIYMFGGKTKGTGSNYDRNTIYCFDAEDQTVTKLSATLPERAPNYPSAAAVGTNILIVQVYASTANNKIYCFDTLTNTITTLPFTMPGVVQNGSLVSDGQYAYFVGGSIASTNFYGVLRIDVENQTVTDLGVKFTTWLVQKRAEFIGGKIFVWGNNPSDTSTYCVETMDVQTGIAQRMKISDLIGNNYAFYYTLAVTCGDAIYMFDGFQTMNSSGTKIKNVYKFKASAEKTVLNKDTLQLKPTLDKNKFSLIGSESLKIKIGIASAFKGNENNEAEQVEAALYKDGSWTTI